MLAASLGISLYSLLRDWTGTVRNANHDSCKAGQGEARAAASARVTNDTAG